MSSDKHCCVPGCKDSGGTNAVLHKFPNPETERERFNTWLYAIGGDVLTLENEHIYKYRRVCRSHFMHKYLCRNNKLSNIAVPTLNMPDVLSKMKFGLHEEKTTQKGETGLVQPCSSSDPGILLEQQVYNKPLFAKKCVNIEISAARKDNPDPRVKELPVPVYECLQIENNEKENCDPGVKESPVPVQIENDKKESCNPGVKEPVNESLQIENKEKENCSVNQPKKNTRRVFLTPRERELHKIIVTTKIKLSKIKNTIKRQKAEIKAAKKISTNSAIWENCSKTAQLLMKMQWRENKKRSKGRRFTTEEKILALSMLKQNPKGYRFFRRIFILPAPQTLAKLVQKTNLKPGLNKNIFENLKKKAASMNADEKLCLILFDEIALKPNISYNERKDRVIGFVDDGLQREAQYADHAQVFMVRGLVKNYKQAVSYSFSASATKGPNLARQFKDVVSGVQEAGLIVVASVCDQGTNNRHAIKLLLNETRGVYLRRGDTPKDNTILINDQEIIPLYDPPHLLKGIRNNLMKKNLNFSKDGEEKTAKWAHLEMLLKENPGYKGVRMIPKLTENHVNTEKINKMKVKYASQIFSRTIASNMGYLADKNILPAECKDTADLLLVMDTLFDSVNGSNQKNKFAKPLLGPATPTSIHNKTWQQSIKILKTMRFINSTGKEETVPTTKNWVWTLEGIQILLKNLRDKYNVTSVWLRHLNQDPIENFFGSVRSHGCRNNNPTCDQFESAFTTILINNLNSVHTPGKNCEDDFGESIQSLVVTDNNTEPSSTHLEFNFEDMININLIPIEEKTNNPHIDG